MNDIKSFILNDTEISDWVKKNDELFHGKLKNFYNYSRVVSLAYFNKLTDFFYLRELNNVAVVSGSENEPELKLLNPKNLKILNFENDPIKYDLDKKWGESDESEKFDLVICNQVFEHIFDPALALKNLTKITKSKGFIYITLPTINGIHGEPYFYSAGYHPRFLERLAIKQGLDCLHLGSWGSRKYLLNAVLINWLTEKNLRRFSILRCRFKFVVPFLFTSDGRKSTPGIITDTWVLLRTR